MEIINCVSSEEIPETMCFTMKYGRILDKIKEENNRVGRANEILARIDNINYSLALMADLTQVRIMSPDRSGWYPRIPTNKIKEFVEQTYNNELESLRTELEQLYPQILLSEIKTLETKQRQLIQWMLDEFNIGHDGYLNGCITGDCPHEKISECIDILLQQFESRDKNHGHPTKYAGE